VDSDSEATEGRLLDAMDQSGHTYHTWSIPAQGSVPLDTLLLYKVIVWTAGDNNEYSLSDTDRGTMSNYLSQGGALFFSSENYLSAYGEDAFTTSYLHVEDYTISINAPWVQGVSGDPITDGLDIDTDFPSGMSDRPDAITPDSEAAAILTTGYSSQVTALRYPITGTSTYRLIFMAVPFEALEPGTPDPNNPRTFLQNALNWLLWAPDAFPPNPISDLSAGVTQSGDDVVLTWSVPWDNVGVDHFNIYRGPDIRLPIDPNFFQATVGTSPWTDPGIAGNPETGHYYLVTAVDASDNESTASNRVGIIDFGTIITGPSPKNPWWKNRISLAEQEAAHE